MNKRTITIKALLTKSENKHFIKNVKVSGLTKSQFIRESILNHDIKARPPDEFTEIKRLLSNACNNINQLAYVANATGDINYEHIDVIAKAIDKIYEQVMELR